ncbi:unnamed protein product [Merluccius merluccius]
MRSWILGFLWSRRRVVRMGSNTSDSTQELPQGCVLSPPLLPGHPRPLLPLMVDDRMTALSRTVVQRVMGGTAQRISGCELSPTIQD